MDLVEAAKSGNLDMVKYLIEKGAYIHFDDDYALRYASHFGYLDIVKYLIQNGADIHVDDDFALRIASNNGHLEVVKYLIENGADVRADNDLSLRWASYNGDLAVVKYLTENGAYIHADNDDALRRASQNGHLEVVMYLVEKGADIHVFGDSVLRYSSHNGQLDVVKYLIEQGADWTKIKEDPIFPDILREQTNNIKTELTNDYLTLERATPQINIGDKTKSSVPNSLLVKMVYEKNYRELCSAIDKDIPPIRLIALANILKIDYNIDISWINLCDKIKQSLYLLL